MVVERPDPGNPKLGGGLAWVTFCISHTSALPPARQFIPNRLARWLARRLADANQLEGRPAGSFDRQHCVQAKYVKQAANGTVR
jgi:hypothetical protein